MNGRDRDRDRDNSQPASGSGNVHQCALLFIISCPLDTQFNHLMDSITPARQSSNVNRRRNKHLSVALSPRELLFSMRRTFKLWFLSQPEYNNNTVNINIGTAVECCLELVPTTDSRQSETIWSPFGGTADLSQAGSQAGSQSWAQVDTLIASLRAHKRAVI